MAEKKEVKENKESNDSKDAYPEFENDGIKTTHSSLKEKVKLTLEQLKDLATAEVMLPVHVRMKKRLESIRKMGSAEHIKVDGHWKTVAPEIHLIGLQGRKITPDECEIRFSVFDSDDKGNKKLYEKYVDIVLNDGSKVKRCMSAEYKVKYEVVERIKYRKPITREITKVLEE